MATTTISGDWEYFQSGQVAVCNNVWHKLDYVNGIDFTQSITFDPNNLLKNVSISWDWPSQPSWNVVSYPEIIVGYKPWGQSGDTSLSSQIGKLKSFSIDYDLSLHGDGSHNNIAFECWLTDQNLGNESTITTEVMVWVHNESMTPPGEIVGTYKSASRIADIYSYSTFGVDTESSSWDYVAVVFREDHLNGKLDFKDLFGSLAKQGLVSRKDYVGGFELGAEVNGGSDGFTINSMNYNIEQFTKIRTAGATSRNDTLVGTAQDDLLNGRRGNDVLQGDDGNDRLIGGQGTNVLWGGQGSDVFVFGGRKAGFDIVADFQSGEDVITISGRRFGIETPEAGLDASALQSRSDLSSLLHIGTDGVYGDFNGDGHFAKDELIVKLRGAQITLEDLVLV